MKASALFLALVFVPWIVQAGDFNIAVSRKKGETVRAPAVQSGKISEGKENVFYEVTVSNQAFKPTPAVEARYILFVERQELGKKPGLEKIESIKGTAPIATLAPHASQSFKTSEATLREQSLAGSWVFEKGGRIRTKDSVVGVWVKLFNGATEVGEYINPSTLSSKQKWE